MLLKGLLLKASWIADIDTISLLLTASGGVGVLKLSWATRHAILRFLFERPACGSHPSTGRRSPTRCSPPNSCWPAAPPSCQRHADGPHSVHVASQAQARSKARSKARAEVRIATRARNRA